MPEILDYLDNYNRPITSKLNIADQMIFARLPFLPLAGIVSEDLTNQISLPTAMRLIEKSLSTVSKYLLLPNDRVLIKKLATSFRYQNVMLSGFRDLHENDLRTQCAALLVQTEPHQKVIIYRGADGTSLGWKSDLKITYDFEEKSWQTFSLTYLDQVLGSSNDALQLIGFSKGGTMAIWAATMAAKEIQSHIQQVVNFDGPQFSSAPKIADSLAIDFHTYLPQLPFFGIGSSYPSLPKIVFSSASGIWQHDLYSWRLQDDAPLVLGTASVTNSFLNTDLRTWLHNQKPEDVNQFVEIFWKSLNDTQAITVNDLIKHWQQVTKNFQIASQSWNLEAKEMGQKALQAAFQIIVSFTRF